MTAYPGYGVSLFGTLAKSMTSIVGVRALSDLTSYEIGFADGETAHADDYDDGYAAGYAAGFAAGLEAAPQLPAGSYSGYLGGYLGAHLLSEAEDVIVPIPDVLAVGDAVARIDHVEAAIARLAWQFSRLA